MPRLPKNVPLSNVTEYGISASMVFACKNCFHTEWSFNAYNHEGTVTQMRKCAYWACLNQWAGGKWITFQKYMDETIDEAFD